LLNLCIRKPFVTELQSREGRAICLEAHPNSTNGYYTRDLLPLVGPLEDLKVLRAREGGFRLRMLLYGKKTSLELSEAVLALWLSG